MISVIGFLFFKIDLVGKSCYTLINLLGKEVSALTEINTNDPKIQRILNAGLREFSQRGYEEASTNRIAKAAGMSKALMFHYVKSKEDSYILQFELIKGNPCILVFTIVKFKKTSVMINQKVADLAKRQHSSCEKDLFEGIDETKFRTGLNVDRCKQLILWGNIGFTNEILEELKNTNPEQIDYQAITDKLTQYLEDLKNVFYQE